METPKQMQTPTPTSTTDQSDQQIIWQLQRGQSAAVADFVRLYQDRLFAVMLRMTGNVDDASELVQETFLRALANLDRFKGHSSVYTWVFRIAVNLALSKRRSNQRHPTVSLDALAEPVSFNQQAANLRREFAQDTEGDPAQLAAARVDHETVLDALDQLDAPLRAVLVLRDIDDASYSQIAEVLEMPEGTVKSRIFRARVALREKILRGKHSPMNQT